MTVLPLVAALISGLAAAPTKIVMREARGEVLIEDLVFKTSLDDWVAAYRVSSTATKPAPAIMFVHWLETSQPTSNRSQFLDEAIELAKRGSVTSLLIETMWSQPDWFAHRDPAKDRDATDRQLKRVKEALDLLLESPNIDPRRVAYVGHDFGGMAGAVLSKTERRVQFWAIQAATARWHEWYLLGRKLPPEGRKQAAEATAAIDPVLTIADAKGSFLFQFGSQDSYVPRRIAEEFYAAAPDPKQILWYDAGHGLNDQAKLDRIAWLARNLKFGPIQ